MWGDGAIGVLFVTSHGFRAGGGLHPALHPSPPLLVGDSLHSLQGAGSRFSGSLVGSINHLTILRINTQVLAFQKWLKSRAH